MPHSNVKLPIDFDFHLHQVRISPFVVSSWFWIHTYHRLLYIVVYIQQCTTNISDCYLLGIENAVVNKADLNLCLPGAHFLGRGNKKTDKSLESDKVIHAKEGSMKWQVGNWILNRKPGNVPLESDF